MRFEGFIRALGLEDFVGVYVVSARPGSDWGGLSGLGYMFRV